uniref:Fus6 n=1 Tax=Arundo donax TaxID=35708 RepID=A0A0A9HL41_ARUDO
MSIEEITHVIVTHSDALLDQVGPVAVELVLELLLALLGAAVDSVDPGLVEPVSRAEAAVDFECDVAVELRVLSPLDLVVRHPQSLELHQLHPAPLRDEDKARQVDPPGVLRGVGLHVQLLGGERRQGGLLPAQSVRHRGGDLALDVHAGGDRV